MNKITTNSYCSCGNDNETILRIVAGNDFTLRLRLTQKDGEQVVAYDLSNAENLEVRVVTPDGDKIILDSFIDTFDKVIATVDAQQFDKYVPYSIEVVWRDEPYDKRAAAPNLFSFVNTSREANDAQDVIVEGPYDYNLEILSDVAYVTVGEIPSIDLTDYYTREDVDEILTSYVQASDLDDTLTSYVTDNELDDILLTYVKKEDLDNTLTSYVQQSTLDDTLTSYVKNSDLDNTLTSYVKTDTLNDTLTSYVQKTELDDTLNSYTTFDDIVQMTYTTKDYVDTAIGTIPQPDLSDYYNKQDIDNTLTSYVQQSTLDNTLTSYTTFDDIVGMTYTTKQYVDDAVSHITPDLSNYYNKQDIDNTLTSYAKYSDLTSYIKQEDLDNVLASYVLHDELDNYNEAIATVLTYNKQDLLNTYTYFNNYYTKIEGDARYVTSSQVANNYVDFSSLDNVTYTTAAGLCDIDDRVSYIEDNVWTHSGGGGGPLPSDVVTCEDASYIWMLSQNDYDTLEQQQQLDNDTFYYISDATSNYVTQTQLNNAISGVTIDETNLVHKTGTETITGAKTFSGNMTFDGETTFQYSSPASLYYMDIANPIYKSSMMARSAINQIITCEIIAGNVNQTNSTNGMNQEANKIKFEKVTGTFNQHHPRLLQIAAIDDTGIYEGTTLLANKYVQSSTIRNIVQITQNDYNNLSTPDVNTLYIII